MGDILEAQLALFHSVAKALDNFKKIGRNNYSPAKIRSQVVSLKETWAHYLQYHAALLTQIPATSRDIPYFKDKLMDQHEDIYQGTLDYLAEHLERLEPPVSPNQSIVNATLPRSDPSALSVKHLPPIQLPPFSGDVKDWETFRDRFSALIIENKALSDFTRMHFLASSLTDRARDAIAGMAITAENFPSAWKALVARFENKRKLIHTHVAILHNLPQMTRESAVELHALRDGADRAIAALKRLDRFAEEMLSDILTYFVSNKLDPATLRAWTLRSGSDPSDVPSYTDLTRFISSRAIALEEISPAGETKRQSAKVHHASVLTASGEKCALCDEAHYLSRCAQFRSKEPSQRLDLVKKFKCCFNCLNMNHSVQDCASRFTCRHCNKKHHSLLHFDSTPPLAAVVTNAISATGEVASEPSESNALVLSSSLVASQPSSTLLATAKVLVSSREGRATLVRALIDQGSEVSLISENLAQTLRLPRLKTHTSLSVVGDRTVSTCHHAALIDIASRDRAGPTFSTRALIIDSLTKYTPRISQPLSSWSHLAHLYLADDDPTSSEPISLLIGAELHSELILPGVKKGKTGEPIAQQSYLGWLISGPTARADVNPRQLHVFHCQLDHDLQRFWEIEEIPRCSIPSPEERRCEEHFLQTHSRARDGKYIVRLPFQSPPPLNLGESRSIALRRLMALKRRLDADPDLKTDYFQFLSEYQQSEHMVKVPPPADLTQTVYIPHHPVIRASSSTTRVRVIFNASSLTSNGVSLNSQLEAGPKLQTDLAEILIRWRQHRYVYIADIAKMFRQIWIDPRDVNYQSILWFDGALAEVHDYQLRTVTYGTVSAPFLALRVIQQLIRDEGTAFPLASDILRENIYVDDVLFGAEDIPLLRQSRSQVCDLLARGGFSLRKWASNKSSLLQDISPEDHGLACDRSLPVDESLAVLGISWNPALDTFRFQVSLPPAIPRTKRQMLSSIAKLFDPLGWVTPVIVRAKILIQQLWKLKLDWDESIPPSIMENWTQIYTSLPDLNEINLPRWIQYGADTVTCEIHGFADASTFAYAAVAYLRMSSHSGETTTHLIAAKSKVAPIKPCTVPRLELLATVLLARLIEFIRAALKFPVDSIYCWTDSTVALTWIQAHPSKWRTFVAHRVADIQSRLPHAKWQHVPTSENPADCASRGLLSRELGSFNLWWRGPPWLGFASTAWPASPISTTLPEIPEASSTVVHHATTTHHWDLADKFSTWPKLIRITAYLIRFVNNCKRKSAGNGNAPSPLALSAPECHTAKLFWLRTIQQEGFAVEHASLQNHRPLSPKSSIISLCPFIDSDSLIRVGGRLQNAPLSFQVKHPVLLPNHPLLKLIVRHAHIRSLHAGLKLTLATLRQEYWIVRGRSIVKQVIHQCVACTRECAQVPQQLMGQLPLARVSTPARPFAHCGLDYAGPVLTRPSSGRGIHSRKGYIALFVCLASRALHLELVSNYTTSSFLEAFSRFCARRGLPTTMYSDNRTTFTGADRELTVAFRAAMRDPNFQNKTATDNITWKFISPHAPHFGGLWEAGVRSLKHHLRRVLGSHTLTFEEFSTLLCRIEACLNSRPIGSLSDSPDDFAPLTPGHFLIGTALTVSPEPSLLDLRESRLSRWQLIRQLTERLWKVWQHDYVNTLQQRNKWRQKRDSIKLGTLVLIKNPLLPPCKWELGRVTKCHTGPDGLVRVVDIKTANSSFTRPIVKVCILLIDTELDSLADKPM